MTQNNDTVAIVNGKLILTFPDADTPVVWQMDLEKAAACALEVKEDKKAKLFSLVLRDADNQTNTIASFAEKSQAVSALMATSKALQSGQGTTSAQPAPQPAPAQAYAPQPQYVIAPQAETKGEGKKAAIIALVLILLLLGIWSISIPTGQIDLANIPQSGSATSAAAPAASTGVAVSADEFLKGR